MCGTRRRLLPLALLLAGCAANPAPRDFLPDAKGAGGSVRGGWIELQLYTDREVEGELLGVSADSVWLGEYASPLAFPLVDVRRATLTAYDPGSGMVAGLMLLGTLSTASNGMLAVFTAPMWLIGGSLAAAAQSRVPRYELDPDDWRDFVPFARFPAGMPARVAPPPDARRE